MIIPPDQLAAETLQRVLEEFVTREGTDNGDESSLVQRVDRVRRALAKQEAFIVYDCLSQQCNLVLRAELPPELLEDIKHSKW